MFPLPFTCEHEAYTSTSQDEHGNDVPHWADPVSVPCFWWTLTAPRRSSAVELQLPPTGGDRVRHHVSLVVDSDVAIDPRDVFTVDGRRFEVVGLPEDYDHGPFGFVPGCHVVALEWVG